jgi:two-component system, chemotaxis family, sensor kinase CheA
MTDTPHENVALGERLSPPDEEFFETVRVEIAEFDKLLDGITEASAQITALRQEAEVIARARLLARNLTEELASHPQGKANSAVLRARDGKICALAEELRDYVERLECTLRSGVDQIEAEFTGVRNAANHLRLLPAAAIFPPLERAVRDAARALHKDVRFESSGGENRLDAHVLAAIRGALFHVVRNAVAHGIESQPQRAAAGKSPQGRVEVLVERRGGRIAFICRDDGRGIDVEAIRRAAVRRGLVASSVAASLGLDEIIPLFFQGRVTTSQAVNAISGCGIGLDVLRETTARLKGDVTVVSEPGKGTAVEIVVPVLLSLLAALEVEAGGAMAALPLDAVRKVLGVGEHEVTRSHKRESIVYEGKIIPFLALARALRAKTRVDRRQGSTVVLEASSGTVAVGVDRVVGARNLVVTPLPRLANADNLFAGASMDAEGNPRLILDPQALVSKGSLKPRRLLSRHPKTHQ